jgi:hypothetical protein
MLRACLVYLLVALTTPTIAIVATLFTYIFPLLMKL